VVIGKTLGPYHVLGKLGEGGMGEVYRARDTRLERDVAVKVLAADLIGSPQARERFQREARAVAALSHPNICTIHDVGETSDGQTFLVMELLQGETLQERLRNGPLDVGHLVDLGIALADALAVAHGAGIVHRDIKPANIFLTAHGPKILDFGLAKANAGPVPDASMQPTMPRNALLTDPGSTVGTVAYMSPEQLRGEELDARTDLFSFGLVLYEMATGRPAFAGSTSAVIAAAILHQAPASPGAIRPGLPGQLDGIILKALEKDRVLRYRHASDVRTDLQGVKPDSDSARTTVSVKPRVRPVIATRTTVIVSAVAGIVALAFAAYVSVRRAPALTDKDTIVLADFVNKTGDPVFDDTLRQGLAVELQQSPFLSLVSDARIRQTLALMEQPNDIRLTPEIAQQICVRTASAAILEGSVVSLGTGYVLGLRATGCNAGSILDQEQIQAARREDVLNSLSQIARRFRTRVGESLATVEQHSMPLAEATTPSLEALKAYSTALKVDVSSGGTASIPFFRRAVEIDPNFAMAYANLGLGYTVMGEWALARENTTRAWQLRDRASDREKFFITFTYYRQVTGDLEKAFQTLELWAQTYPRGAEPSPQHLMAGLSASGTGRFEKAIEEGRKGIAADPGFIFSYGNLAISYFFLDRFREAAETLQRASKRKLDTPDSLVYGYNIAFLNGDTEEMDRAVALARGKHGAEHGVANSQALVLARSGQLRLAQMSSSRAIDLARQEGQGETSATYQAASAEWEALYGNALDARKGASAALGLSNERDVEYAAGLALALSGDVPRSQALADDLQKRFPEDTFARFTYVPVLRGLAALHRGRPEVSIEELQVALRYELAVNGLNFHLCLGGLHSAYVRGEAFMAAHRYAEAVAEFQKILDHRGLVGADPIGALAHLQLGRAFVLAGDNVKGKAAYQDFFGIWKDADPNIPMLKQAQAEYADLR
jgi:serine/threonine protein kinase/tetratricopeptide (TPR) repeat protein